MEYRDIFKRKPICINCHRQGCSDDQEEVVECSDFIGVIHVTH